MNKEPKLLLKYIDNDTKIILHTNLYVHIWDSFNGILINVIDVSDYFLPPSISPDNTKIIYSTKENRNKLIQPSKTEWVTNNGLLERIKVIDIRDGKTILDLDVNLVEHDTIKLLTFDNTGNFIRCITRKGDYYLFDLNGIKIEQPYLDCNHFYYKQNDGTNVIYENNYHDKYAFSMDGNKVGIFNDGFGHYLDLTILDYKENKLLDHLELYDRNHRTYLNSIQIFNYYDIDIYEKTEDDDEDIGNHNNDTIISAIKKFNHNNGHLILFKIPHINHEETEHQYIWENVKHLSDPYYEQENVINYVFSPDNRLVAYYCEINYHDSDNDSVSSNNNGKIKDKLIVKEIKTGEIIAEMSNNNLIIMKENETGEIIDKMSNNNLIFDFYEFSRIVGIAFNEKNTQLICFDDHSLIILEINYSHQSFIPIGIMEYNGLIFRERNITFPLFVPNNNPESTENTYIIKSSIDRFGDGNPADTIIYVDTNEPDFFIEMNQKQEQRRSITESKGGKKKTKKNKKNKKTTKRKKSTKKIKSNKNKNK